MNVKKFMIEFESHGIITMFDNLLGIANEGINLLKKEQEEVIYKEDWSDIQNNIHIIANCKTKGQKRKEEVLKEVESIKNGVIPNMIELFSSSKQDVKSELKLLSENDLTFDNLSKDFEKDFNKGLKIVNLWFKWVCLNNI